MSFPSLRQMARSAALAMLCALAAACAQPPAPVASTCEAVEGLDPGCVIERGLLKEALASYRAHYDKIPVGMKVALTEGGTPIPFTLHWLKTNKLVVIDFRKPAFEKRLYVVDWKTGLVDAYHVSHGRGSALNERSYYAKRFTNLIGSGTSSVGAYVAGQQYESQRWGHAMRLIGLDRTNDRALERTIVFHANESFFDSRRRVFGWSCGCFMMDAADLRVVTQLMENGGFIYAGPISLFDASTASKTRECNPYCGDQDRCNLATGANATG